ncbi:MAG: Gfo/Idh/MocA family oxidoreductase, partial [Chloroflexi bacterium]|nr:Gfo/Idh/MocA family oxidoreductase [Chloroflexota bacterium]
MSGPKVRVGVLGYGYWGPNIVRTLREMPDAELAVCCDASPGRLREARDRLGVPVTGSWEDVLADPSVDAVVVATPARTQGLRRYDCGARPLAVDWREPLRLELEAFCARVRGDDRASGVSPESVLTVTRTLEAIGRSMARGGAPERLGG